MSNRVFSVATARGFRNNVLRFEDKKMPSTEANENKRRQWHQHHARQSKLDRSGLLQSNRGSQFADVGIL